MIIGWGAYLQAIDPQHRPWQWHVKRTIIYCTVHFKRGLQDCLKKGKLSLVDYERLLQITTLKSRDDIHALLDDIDDKW